MTWTTTWTTLRLRVALPSFSGDDPKAVDMAHLRCVRQCHGAQDELGQTIAEWWPDDVLHLTGCSSAVGVPAQVLWESRSLTVPLGRLQRVRGSRA